MFDNVIIKNVEFANQVRTFGDTLVHFGRRATNGFVFYIDGKNSYKYDEISFTAEKNCFVFLPAGKEYSVYSHEASFPLLINVEFQTDTTLSPFILNISNATKLHNLFLSAISVYNKKNVGYKAALMSYVYQIISLIQKEMVKIYLPNIPFKKIEPAINYIEEKISELDLRVETLAKMCNLSTRYFNKIFKIYFNTSPKQYILNKKIDIAKGLLVSDKKKISEISEICGFNDSYHFSRMFKKVVGVSALAYRNLNIGK